MNILAVTQMLGSISFSERMTIHEALSGIFGSISLATWIFLLIPQLVMNFRRGTADGLSLLFIVVWMIGDITNLAGAIWAGLVPTVIALAMYFCFSDVILLCQTLYYNYINAAKDCQSSIVSVVPEEEPLLSHRRSSDTIGLPGSHRCHSSAVDHHSHLNKISEGEEEKSSDTLERNLINVVAVMLIGTAGWFIAWKAGVWTPVSGNGVDSSGAHAAETPLGASILGYSSAILYLGARLPQIYKNYQAQSCEGLALGFFMLSTLGNITYGASILCHSLEREYILTTLPWLIGSLGTIVEDVFIFVQFRMYGEKPEASSAVID